MAARVIPVLILVKSKKNVILEARMENQTTHLRRFLRETRKVKNGRITQNELAAVAGRTQPAVVGWLKGATPRPETAHTLARYFVKWHKKHPEFKGRVPTFEDLLFPFGLPRAA